MPCVNNNLMSDFFQALTENFSNFEAVSFALEYMLAENDEYN